MNSSKTHSFKLKTDKKIKWFDTKNHKFSLVSMHLVCMHQFTPVERRCQEGHGTEPSEQLRGEPWRPLEPPSHQELGQSTGQCESIIIIIIIIIEHLDE